MEPVRVLFFDIDGTMLSTGGAGQKAMELALVEDFGVDFPFDGILTAGRTDCGIADEIFERFQLRDTAAERTRFMQSYLQRLPHCLQELPGALLPGVRDLLEHLSSDKSVVLSLLTGNYEVGAWIKLKHFQIDHYFQTGGFGDEHPHRNDVARLALATTQQHVGRSIHVPSSFVIGDTPADIQCARAIDARVLAVATGVYTLDELSPHEPDHLFADLSQTSSILNALIR